MKVEKIKVLKLRNSLYSKILQNVDEEAIYCEIQYQRDRSSFAGVALKVTEEKNGITIKECEEKIIKIVSKYEKVYVGCDENYITSIMDIFKAKERSYGIEIFFLIYSDVRSSQIIFEELMECVDEYVADLKEIS